MFRLSTILTVAFALFAANVFADGFAPYRAVCEIRTGNSQGSGTLIAVSDDKALVLSCRHVCEKEGDIVQVRWPAAGNQTSLGVVLKVIKGEGFDTDQAVVMCGRPVGIEPRKYSKFNPDDGPFIMVGYRDNVMRAQVGSVTEAGELLIMMKPAVGGMSGGPLYNSRGEICGIVVASDRATISYCSNGKVLTALIQEFKTKPTSLPVLPSSDPISEDTADPLRAALVFGILGFIAGMIAIPAVFALLLSTPLRGLRR